MGSGSSVTSKTNVSTANSPSIDDKRRRSSLKKTESIIENTQEDRPVSGQSSQSRAHKTGKYERLYKDLEKQMGAVEVANLDLQDKIQILEQQIEYNKNSAIVEEEEPEESTQDEFVETVKAKDIIIDKMNSQIEDLQKEIKKLKIKCKKRVRAANSKVSEAQQGSSLKTFELNNEIRQLKEENDKLIDRLREYDSTPVTRPKTACSENGEAEESEPRMKLILDLSAQVSQQDDRIVELQNRLHEKEKVIIQLMKHEQRPKTAEKSPTVVETAANSSDLTELQQIAAEMKALKAGKKRKTKKKAKSNTAAGDDNDEEDFRGSSGVSRDSGIEQHMCAAEQSQFGVLQRESSAMVEGLMNSALNQFSSYQAPRTALSDDEDKWTSDTLTLEEDNNEDTDHTVEIDDDKQSGIRRISAMKKRRTHKDIELSARKGNKEYCEVESLIQCIDQTTTGLSQVSS